MPIQKPLQDAVRYRVVLVRPQSRMIFVFSLDSGPVLPTVAVEPHSRPWNQLRKRIYDLWRLRTFIIGFVEPDCVVAEIMEGDEGRDWTFIGLDELIQSGLSETEQNAVATLLSRDAGQPLGRIGWMDQAIAWVESSTNSDLSSKIDIEQINAGGGCALVRFQTEDGHCWWLKAVAPPNEHEFAITRCLSKLASAHLPEILSFKPEWNAWLMAGQREPLAETPSDPPELERLLENAIGSLAALQLRTVGHGQELLETGTFHQSIRVLESDATPLFAYLEEAMRQQTSTKIPRVEASRIREMRRIFEYVCARLQDLELPETIVHGDMNLGNILFGGEYCQFIDWSEGYVGNPLITLQHLLLFNKTEDSHTKEAMNLRLKKVYRDAWGAASAGTRIEDGFVFMPLLAVVSALYGTGRWLTKRNASESHYQTYARNLTRRMDEAANDPELLAHFRLRSRERVVVPAAAD